MTVLHRQLALVRAATLASLAMAVFTTVFMPGIGLARESDPTRVWLGAAGIALLTLTQSGVLYAAVTPSISARAQRWLLGAFAAAVVLSLPLTVPLAAESWRTWAWVGAAVIGTAPMLGSRAAGWSAVVAALAGSAGAAWWNGDSPGPYLLITAGIGLGTIAITGVHAWLWNLFIAAREGQAAQSRLAATEERLRFASDVHDILGHTLSVIALKSELAERLATADPGRAGQESAEVNRLAATALADLRRAVHGYREIDLGAQLDSLAQVLRSSGIRCTVTDRSGGVPAATATLLAFVLREAGTNILRHSGAAWCTIELSRHDGQVRMTVTNDGAAAARPDRHSSGLDGLRDRLAEAGGTLRTRAEGGLFTLEAALPAAA
ncbi:sensor histidine kinase [Nonomuraea sp. NPDC050328]|uniref:sensor histidine kinase n=1 Tax=Nonomuraea sp. NPDC050328 TaxID=3364361 RepID=UPI0037B7B01F